MWPIKKGWLQFIHLVTCTGNIILHILDINYKDFFSNLIFYINDLRYGFYGDVITESEKYRWMGPKRYDYAGTMVFLRHRHSLSGYDMISCFDYLSFKYHFLSYILPFFCSFFKLKLPFVFLKKKIGGLRLVGISMQVYTS